MKARNRKTGEILEVEVYSGINDNGFAYQVPAGKGRWLLFREDELDFDDLTDWSSFRREAAKDILVGICANWGKGFAGNIRDMPDRAIELADVLIAKLKEK